MSNHARRRFAAFTSTFAFATATLAFFDASTAHADDEAPPAVAKASEPSTALKRCAAPDWKKRAYLGARDALVTVEPIGLSVEAFAPLAGFVYPTRSHVTVVSDAIGVGRGVRVTFPNHETRHGRAVTVDEKNHLAVLVLDREAPAAAVTLADVPLEVGDEVASIAPFEGTSVTNPDETALDAFLSVGHVANVGDRTTLLLDGSNGGTRGAAVLDCDGKVVALRDYHELVPAAKIRALVPSASPLDDRHWSFLHLNAGFLVQADTTRPWVGASFGWAAVHADRWQLRVAMGALLGIPKESERLPDEKLAFGRLQLEPTLGYRVLLSESTPLYLVPQVGVVGRMDIETRRTTTYTASGSCLSAGQGACPVDVSVGPSSTRVGFGASPTIGLTFLGVIGAVGYQWQMDVQDPRRSTHQVLFGIEF